MGERRNARRRLTVSRVTATAGLAIASCLVAWSALAVPAAAATASGTPAHKASTTKKKGKSGTTHKSSGNGGVSSPGGPLPQPVAGCLGMHGNPAPRGTPWAQQALDYQSVWQFTQGAGVTVAVIDSGVDANSQFGDRVVAGQT